MDVFVMLLPGFLVAFNMFQCFLCEEKKDMLILNRSVVIQGGAGPSQPCYSWEAKVGSLVLCTTGATSSITARYCNGTSSSKSRLERISCLEAPMSGSEGEWREGIECNAPVWR